MVIATAYKIDTRGLDRTLRAASKTVSDLRFAFGEIVRDFRKSNKQIFSLQGSGQYSPLRSETIERKRKLAGRRLPILVGAKPGGGVSGRLRDSLTGNPTSDSVIDIGKKKVTMGTQVPYAISLQKGTRDMPARPPVIVTDTRLKRWTAILSAEINRQTEKLARG